VACCSRYEALEGGQVTGHQLDRYPFPIACPARLLAIADDPADRLDKALHFVELTATTLAIMALGWCQANSLSPDGVVQWEKKLEPFGITLGTWIAVSRSASKVMAASPHDPLARAIRLSAEAALRGMETYNPTRNVYAHGGKPRLRSDQDAAVSELDSGVSAILDGIEPLTHTQFGLIRDCQPSGTSYEASVDLLSGYVEPFPIRRVRSPVCYEQGTVIAYHQGSLEFAVDLTPFCVWQTCPACHRDELFYLHQRKKRRRYYFSFSTGHQLILRGDIAEKAPRYATTLRTEPLGSVRAAAVSGWRASWADLASRSRRLAARAIDLVCAGGLAAVGWLLASVIGALPPVPAAAIAVFLGAAYEPVTVLTGGTPGKRLLRIEPISIWDGRALGRADNLRRALLANAQVLFPPLAVRNLAWLLYDPARQCLHDRRAASIVIDGRSRPGHKV
jgi:RDD family